MKRFFKRWWTRHRQRRAAIFRASKSNIRGMDAPRRRSLLGRSHDQRRDARQRHARWLRRAVAAGFVVAAGWIFWQSWIGWRIFEN
jgi:anti-sigma factor RsiW